MEGERRVALVTGGAVRLGRAIALGLAARGVDVAIHYRGSAAAAAATAAEAEALGVRAVCVQADLASVDEVEGLIGAVVERLGRVDVLVNNASVYEAGTLRETSAALWEAQMAVNLRAPVLLMRELARHMETRGEGARGDIINIIDTKTRFNQYPFTAYVLSKKALLEATRLAAVELGPRLRVNGVSPGLILPPEGRPSAYIEARRAASVLGIFGAPGYVVQAIDFLLDCPYVTGQILVVDGGEAEAQVGMNVVSFNAATRPQGGAG